MPLSEGERTVLERRRRMVASWPFVGAGLLAGVVALWVYLHFQHPLLADPLTVVMGVRNKTIAPAEAEMMQLCLPIVVLLCLGLVTVCIGFAWIAFWRERYYLRLIDRLVQEGEAGGANSLPGASSNNDGASSPD